MALGSPILSPARMQLRHLAIFASWENARALDDFLMDTELGHTLALGWHVRLEFLRRWGRVSEFDDLPTSVAEGAPNQPVVAVPLARLKLTQVPRFIRWGKPVEELVRDHPGTTLALAAMRPPRTVSTFSVWRSQREMIENGPRPRIHPGCKPARGGDGGTKTHGLPPRVHDSPLSSARRAGSLGGT